MAAGLTREQFETWRCVGIPMSNPHWILMCEASRACASTELHLTPERLTHDPDLRDAVLEVFQRGGDGVDALFAAAEHLGVGTAGIDQELRGLRLAGDFDKKIDEALAQLLVLSRSGPVPHDVPDVVDHVMRVATLIQKKDDLFCPLNAQVQTWRNRRQVGSLLSHFVRTKGVQPSRLTNEVLDTWKPVGCPLTPDHRDALRLLQNTDAEAALLFVDAETVRLTDRNLSGQISGFLEEDIQRIRVPRGIAVVMVPSPRRTVGEPHILAWEASSSEIRACLVPFGKDLHRLATRAPASYQWWRGRDGLGSAREAVRLVRLINVVIGVDAARTRAIAGDSGRRVIIDDMPAPLSHSRSDIAVSTHTLERTRMDRGGVTYRAEPGYRWDVRGHWRQLAPTDDEPDRRTWVRAHTAGPTGKPVFHVRRVSVVSAGGLRAPVMILES